MSLVSRLFKHPVGLCGHIVLLAFLVTGTPASAQVDQAVYDNGEKIFKANCGSCHKPDKDMTGPAVKGAKERWDGKGDVHEWIKDSQGYIKSGNAHAKQIFEEHNKIVMPPQALTNEEIDAVLYYADNFAPAGAKQAEAAAPEAAAQEPSSSWQWLVVTGLILLLVLLSLGGVRHQLSNAVREKQGLAPEPALGTWGRIRQWAVRNKGWASVTVLLVVVWALVLLWNFLFNIGVYGGDKAAHYKPSQPIAFDHSLHAGKDNLAINCQYCHSGAEKSKHAGIPSANVCMNCHQAISEGPNTGTAEIAKIYAATGWDPAAMKYTGEQKPIVWNKVHNLPDHVFFSHQQHVAVGKLECQECHGPVDTEMDQVQQWSPLTMAWCLDCHNTKEVAVAGSDNGYYQEIHRRMATTPMGQGELRKYLEDEKITVRELGGFECAKCHY
ncbi:MAG: c-type cytochrome [Flavobacteriales bacterium]|nr:c-type cytochrome [Flavobacteriales bacterium]MBP9079046.1 c-type cytochrome [Flavobacteriales bacterium]